ncbi:MAG: DUF354 domain-containing protein [Chloroflexota bacterium]|nr:DUF354 domain-containing protein [Chloroflexota bacterium]
MRISVDIGHPGHVHFFKNFIWEMQEKGHHILITTSDKDVAIALLYNYGLKYTSLGSYGDTPYKKMANLPIMDYKMYKALRDFGPDILVGLGSIRAAHVSALMRKPCINFDDTEHAKVDHILYAPMTEAILTPLSFKKGFGTKHIRYDGYHELAYLHPNRFSHDTPLPRELKIQTDDPIITMRFASFKASHDNGTYGFSDGMKEHAVNQLKKYGRVIITSEGSLNASLERYRLRISPDKLHSILNHSILYLGDGGTTAIEAALLGTPTVHCVRVAKKNHTLSASDIHGNFYELQHNYKLLHSFTCQEEALETAINLLNKKNIKDIWKEKRDRVLREKIDVTGFMMWFIEEYPDSFKQMQTQPETQERFKSCSIPIKDTI